MKYATIRKYNLKTLITLNYAVAAIVALASVLIHDKWVLNKTVITVGSFAGVAFVVSIFILFYAIEKSGVAISMTISRLSTIIPIILSIALWHEIPNAYQMVGFGFVILALVLFGLPKRSEHVYEFNVYKHVILLIFLTSGIVMITPKLAHEVGLYDQKAMYLFWLYITASLISLVITQFSNKLVLNMHGIFLSIVMGLVNIAGTWFLVASMQHLPGIIVFPTLSCLSVILTTVIAKFLWQEDFATRNMVGIGISLIALILVNLGKRL